jgi:predicted peroxiredoxin
VSQYLLIESKGPLDGGQYGFDLAQQLGNLGHAVTLYLVQDGVFTARKRFDAGEKLLDQASARNVTLLADEISLRQRGITKDRLSETVRASTTDELVDLLMERSDKAIWH